MFPASASHFAARTPARQELSAAAWTAASARSSAPEAFTVRRAPSARSRAAPTRPTDSWAAVPASLTRTITVRTTHPARSRTPSVTPVSTGSSRRISVVVTTRVSTPVAVPTSASVVTCRSSAVSEVTRAIRSPGSVRSNSPTRSRRRCEERRRRAVRTTVSAARRSTYCATGPASAVTATRTPMADRTPSRGRSWVRPSMSRSATSGIVRPAAAVSRLSRPPRASAGQEGRM
ncbi:hypothetical protein STANM309S_06792 [Streptomyces tanashiensis]